MPMSMLQQFFSGVLAVFSSFRRIGWGVYSVVVVLCLLVFSGGLFLGGFLSPLAQEWLSGCISLIDVPGFLADIAGFLSGIIVRVASLLIVGAVCGSVILLILSPVLSHVADKAWVAAGHSRPADTFADVVKSILRGVLVAIRCLFLQLFCMILLLVLSFLPIIGLAAPLLGLAVSSFFYGQSLMDYAVERAEQDGVVKDRHSGSFPFRNVGLTVGVGFLFAVVSFIPFVGSYLALFVAPATAYAGGLVVGKDGAGCHS